MKKTLLLIALALIMISGYGYSQDQSSNSKTQLNIGTGFSSWGIPFYIGLDKSVHPDITIGGEFSFRSYREKWEHYNYSHSVMGFSVNANYHFNRLLQIPQNWDFYAGLNLGFFVWSSPNDYYGSHQSGLGLGGQIGGRYFFTEKLGINLEFGGGNAFSGGKLGLTIKL